MRIKLGNTCDILGMAPHAESVVNVSFYYILTILNFITFIIYIILGCP